MEIMLLVVASTIGQCATPCCSSVYVHEKVYFFEEIRSRCIAEAVLPNGRKITVPIINGYMPTVKLTFSVDGSELREYNYYYCDIYDGGLITYGKRFALETRQTTRQSIPTRRIVDEASSIDKPPKIYMPKYTDEDFENLQNNIKKLQQSILILQKEELKYKRNSDTDSLIEHDFPKLKKPSEFGQK